ncbi:hypothetical protein SLEP1_g39451 [Rubroshorea leprosula]|uniref:Uncharacterized protein n=1 Tax=Rubroshorea leprosula TaxID=152421 RepID=A0AAV5L0M5_9ROSI|nr:hypothetical protein SLEP1_g39451 [Rubroshorea leprosula]
MSLGVGAVASSCNIMGLDGEKGSEVLEKTRVHPPKRNDEAVQMLGCQVSESLFYTIEEEDDDDDDDHSNNLQLGPQCTLKKHLEKYKDDESLRKWKEQLLGCVDLEKIGVYLNLGLDFCW